MLLLKLEMIILNYKNFKREDSRLKKLQRHLELTGMMMKAWIGLLNTSCP